MICKMECIMFLLNLLKRDINFIAAVVDMCITSLLLTILLNSTFRKDLNLGTKYSGRIKIGRKSHVLSQFFTEIGLSNLWIRMSLLMRI